MKKNLKSCVEIPVVGEARCLLDMNRYDRIEQSGLIADTKHNRSAHMTAGWRFADRERVCIPLGKVDLSPYRYLTFSVFSVKGAGGSFCLQFDTDAKGVGENAYRCVLSLVRDGWNDFRIELPFLMTVGEPMGLENVASITLDHVSGGQVNSSDTVLYFDNFFVWDTAAPPLYAKEPELKGAAVFARNGNYALVNRLRVLNSLDGTSAKPFEKDGKLWVPLAPVAAGIAHAAVADNLAMTLSFTYRRRKYAFSANSDQMKIDENTEALGFRPIEKNGTLFFPIEFVRDFFRWRQIYTDQMGLIVLSNRKNVFDRVRDEETLWRLAADLTFHRPSATEVMGDVRRSFPNPSRGRLLLSFDDWSKLRKKVKEDPAVASLVDALTARYGVGTDAYEKQPICAEDVTVETLQASSDALIAFALLFRVRGDKKYAERAALEAEGLASLESWQIGASMQSVGVVALAMALGYDWCQHVWSEGRKALLERAMLRRAMRPALDAYDGKGNMWRKGGTVGAVVDTGMLALALTLTYVYPETALKLVDRSLREVETCFAAYAPDGGFSEGLAAWETHTRALGLFVSMLNRACGCDYGFSSAPGFAATAYFPIFCETENGAWNYHNCAAQKVDTSILSMLGALTDDETLLWMRRRELQSEKKQVQPWDILFYQPIEEEENPTLPLDAVYRKAGLAVMRSDWSENALFVGLHGGNNRTPNGDLDAGAVILDCDGERFFSETGGNLVLPELLRRRAEGQNTFVIDPTSSSLPDQNPGAIASLTAMRSSNDCAFAQVDMAQTNDAILRAKRGVLLTAQRSVAVIQDEIVLQNEGEYVMHLWTEADVKLNKSGRMAKLTRGGKTLVCRLCGVGSPAKFTCTPYGESGFTCLEVRVPVKERLRIALVCRMLGEGETGSEKYYTVTPMHRWGE